MRCETNTVLVPGVTLQIVASKQAFESTNASVRPVVMLCRYRLDAMPVYPLHSLAG